MRKVPVLIVLILIISSCKTPGNGFIIHGTIENQITDVQGQNTLPASINRLAKELENTKIGRTGKVNSIAFIEDVFYAVGSLDLDNYQTEAVYWADGQLSALGINGEIRDILAADGKLYFCGKILDKKSGKMKACYWVDGKLNLLPGEGEIAVAMDYSQGKLIIAGEGNNYACYWLNDQFYQLPYWDSHVSDILVVNGSIYIAGTIQGAACYWKDSKLNFLVKGQDLTSVKNTDLGIIFTGSTKNGGIIKAALWIDGKLTVLKEGILTDAAVEHNKLYLCGTQISPSNGLLEAFIWEDSTSTKLEGEGNQPLSILRHEGQTITGGLAAKGNIPNIPCIWIAGHQYFLPAK